MAYASPFMEKPVIGVRVQGTRGRGKGWLLLLALGLAGFSARALDPARPLPACAHRLWNTENGLLQDTATALLESRDGFLWIGTEEGLVRFDGARFAPYSRVNVPAFTNNGVRCLADTPDGALWIGTSQPGLFRFQGGVFTRLGSDQGLPDVPIRRLLRDREGTLWAAPEEGPLLRLEGDRFRPVPCDAAHLRIRALAQGPDGTLWAGGADSGLWRLRGGRLVLSALTHGEITTLEVTADGQIWVGTRAQGLLTLDHGRLEAPAWARALPTAAILTLLTDREGSLWIGTDRAGLFRRTSEGRLERSPWEGAGPWAVLSLLEDSSGALWVGTENRGLHLISEVPFQPIPGPGGDPQTPVRMVCQDAAGTVWCLLGDQRLATLQGGHLERIPTGTALDRGGLSALWPRRAGGLWVGTPDGTVALVERGAPPRRLGSPLGDPILSLYEDPGGALWVSTVGQGLRRLEPGGGPELLFPAEQGVVAMAGGGKGPLYLASRSRGLGRVENGRVQWLGATEGLDSPSVLSLHLDGEEDLWVGTQDGLRLYRDGSLRRFPALPEALRMAIHAILEDADGRLWVTTRRGVVRVDKAALLATLNRTGPVPLVSFDQRDGLPSREMNQGPQPAAWRTREGDLYLPTGRGLAFLDARLRPPVAPRLQVHLEQILSDESDPAPGRHADPRPGGPPPGDPLHGGLPVRRGADPLPIPPGGLRPELERGGPPAVRRLFQPAARLVPLPPPGLEPGGGRPAPGRRGLSFRPFAAAFKRSIGGQFLVFQGFINQSPEFLPIRPRNHCLLMGFAESHRITLASAALVQHQTMRQIQQFFIHGHPFRNFNARNLVFQPQIEEVDLVGSVAF